MFYNWTPLKANAGGGVAVYQKNLLKYLLKLKKHELFFLSSGFGYTGNVHKVNLVKIYNDISDDLKTFEVINSPVIAPVQQSIKNVRHYLEDEAIAALIKQFIKDFGGFDVIHFNNLEGLSLKTLKLKEDFPNTKFIYSLHNYFPVCTGVTLWHWQNKAAGNNVEGHRCNKKSYDECNKCYGKINYNAEIFYRKYAKYKSSRAFSELYSRDFPDEDDTNLYREFEEKNIEYINKYMDNVLAVSQRVKDIFVSYGMNEEKVQVSYIGTDVADIQKGNNCADINANPFKMIYMGYMTEDKGFFFLLKALKAIPEKLSKKIVLTIAARHGDGYKTEIELLNKLKSKFQDIILLDGYKRDELKTLLKDQNLGIVPILWEDNLPQIAIEQIAYGVPILCSNLGGASELHRYNPNFTFEAGNIGEFLQKLENIVNNRKLLKDYWKTVRPLTTMKEHVEFLEQLYMSK